MKWTKWTRSRDRVRFTKGRPMGDIDAIFKAYDVRGITPTEIDGELSRRIGAAFARFVADTERAASIVVGHDMRPTGPEYALEFAEGAMSQGVDVVDIGLVSTDMMYFASGALDLPGAVFTASHNPAEYNGIKMCRRAAAPLGGDTGLGEIKELARTGVAPAFDQGEHDPTRHARFVCRPRRFVRRHRRSDSSEGCGRHGERHGRPRRAGRVRTAAVRTRPHVRRVGRDLSESPADPLQEANLVDLKQRVRELGADIGLAFDGDADRVFSSMRTQMGCRVR